jgi:type II secretory pathway pseudopilin PulG
MVVLVIIIVSAAAVLAGLFYAFLAFSVREHEKYFNE